MSEEMFHKDLQNVALVLMSDEMFHSDLKKDALVYY